MKRPTLGVTLLTLVYLASLARAEAAVAETAAAPAPVQLPAVTVQGTDQSGAPERGTGKVPPAPMAPAAGPRLPEPEPARATADMRRDSLAMVTPSTIEAPEALPGPVMPYTSLRLGGGLYYHVGLYDARRWGGPAGPVGLTELSGHAGLGNAAWSASEWLDWNGKARLGLLGRGFDWQLGPLSGGQGLMRGEASWGESEALLLALAAERGSLTGAQGLVGPGALAESLAARGQWRVAQLGDHALTLSGTGQFRRWGAQAGPEGYARLADFYSLSDAWQLEASLGGGFWGFEPIVDPGLAIHFRPTDATHLALSAGARSLLPEFEALYLDTPARAANPGLASERHAVELAARADHRLTNWLFLSLGAGLDQSERHVFFADPGATGLWTPVNAPDTQLLPSALARLQFPWGTGLTQTLDYRFAGAYPLGAARHGLGTTLAGRLGAFGLDLGLEGRAVSLASRQHPTAGLGAGVFASAEARYDLSREWGLSLTARDLPLAVFQPARNYFVPLPLLTANLEYRF